MTPQVRLDQDPVPTSAARYGEILNLVRRGEAATIAELCDATGLARSTVASRVALLRQEGLLAVSRHTSGGKGRAAAVYAFNPDAGSTLAAHIGMTATNVAVTNLEGRVLASRMLDISVDDGPESVLGSIEEAFRRLLTEAGGMRLHGIGVGLPNFIELATLEPAVLPGAGSPGANWEPERIAAVLGRDFDVPVLVDQDVNLLALAEHRVHWPDAQVLLCVKAGTVISAGVVVHGRIVRGKQGLTGEIGHTPVGSSEVLCNCGNRGCLNAVAGGKALAETLRAAGFTAHTVRDVADLAMRGVPEAVEQIRQSGRRIGDVLAGAVNLLNPEVISVWGYLAEPREHLFAGIRESLYQHAIPMASDAVQLVAAKLGNEAGIRGASMIVLEHTMSDAAVDLRMELVAASNARVTA